MLVLWPWNLKMWCGHGRMDLMELRTSPIETAPSQCSWDIIKITYYWADHQYPTTQPQYEASTAYCYLSSPESPCANFDVYRTASVNGICPIAKYGRFSVNTHLADLRHLRTTIDVLFTTIETSIESICRRSRLCCTLITHYKTINCAQIQSNCTQILPIQHATQCRNQRSYGSLRSTQYCYNQCC